MVGASGEVLADLTNRSVDVVLQLVDPVRNEKHRQFFNEAKLAIIGKANQSERLIGLLESRANEIAERGDEEIYSADSETACQRVGDSDKTPACAVGHSANTQGVRTLAFRD